MSDNFNFHKALHEEEGRRVKLTLESGVQLEGKLELIRGGAYGDVQSYRLGGGLIPAATPGHFRRTEIVVSQFARIVAFEVTG